MGTNGLCNVDYVLERRGLPFRTRLFYETRHRLAREYAATARLLFGRFLTIPVPQIHHVQETITDCIPSLQQPGTGSVYRRAAEQLVERGLIRPHTTPRAFFQILSAECGIQWPQQGYVLHRYAQQVAAINRDGNGPISREEACAQLQQRLIQQHPYFADILL